MAQEIYKRYSIAFKKQVVAEYEAGASLRTLNQRYGITGSTTVQRWVGQYGREGIRHKMVVIQQPEEREHVRQLQAEVQQMKEALAQMALDNFVLKCTLAVAEEELGYEVKKKSHTASSNKPEPPTAKQP